MTVEMPDRSEPLLRYNRTAMFLHWLVAALIAVNLVLIWTINLIPENFVRPAIDTHKSVGITVLGLFLLRVLWRAANAPPPLPQAYSPMEKRAAWWAHILLYALMLALPLSGWLHDSAWKAAAQFPMQLFYLFPWPRIGFIANLDPALKAQLHALFGAVHKWLSYLFYGLFLLHVGAALKHQFWDRKPELERMWPGRDRQPDR